MLYSSSWHNIVNQLYYNFKNIFQKRYMGCFSNGWSCTALENGVWCTPCPPNLLSQHPSKTDTV